MTHLHQTPSRPARAGRTGKQALLMLALCAAATSPVLAATAARPDAQQRYQREQARCMAIKVHGDRANCLSEASTAYQASLPAAVDSDPGRYARNAVARCQALPDADRKDCLARMAGQGSTSGSVAGGGIYRELVTREPAQPGRPGSAASAAPAASAAARLPPTDGPPPARRTP